MLRAVVHFINDDFPFHGFIHQIHMLRQRLVAISPVFVDVEEKEAFVDIGAMHARSTVEKGIKFLPNKEEVPNGKPAAGMHGADVYERFFFLYINEYGRNVIKAECPYAKTAVSVCRITFDNATALSYFWCCL